MNADNHFELSDDTDHTIIRPTPGGRRVGTQFIRSTRSKEDKPFKMDFGGSVASGANPLCALSFTIFSLVPKLQVLSFHHSIDTLKDRLVRQLKEFKIKAAQHGCAADQVRVASYFLCALIDETILNTPWGRQSNWGHQGLLILFHREAQGGEKFFQLLQPMMDRPATYLHLLEMAYLCLSLGFQGQYRIRPDGIRHIDNWRQDLYGVIERRRNTSDQDLSLNWEGVRDLGGSLMRYIPVWVVGAVTGSLLLTIYLGFAYAINHSADRSYKHLMSIVQKQNNAAVSPPVTSAPSPMLSNQMQSLKNMLAEEIAQNKVAVVKGPILRISDAFTSGSDQLKEKYLPVLTKLSEYLRNNPRRLDIIGHTDDQPIFSVRYPSNWHLSNARAERAAMFLGAYRWLENRISFTGQADNEPIVPNDTAENRAINRRIDIHIR